MYTFDEQKRYDNTQHRQEGEKHRKDLEEAIFYLQDEIIKNKPKPVHNLCLSDLLAC